MVEFSCLAFFLFFWRAAADLVFPKTKQSPLFEDTVGEHFAKIVSAHGDRPAYVGDPLTSLTDPYCTILASAHRARRPPPSIQSLNLD